MKKVLAIVVLVLLSAGAVAQDKAKAAPKEEAPKDKFLNGDAKCTRCHDENDSYPVFAIAQTKHGTRADSRTPSCTSCHGASEGHLDKPAKGPRPKPDITFSKTSQTPIDARNQACLTCHQGGKRIHWQMSLHATRDVACTSCHDIHAATDRVRVKVEQGEVCFKCHTDIRIMVNRQSHHPLREGKVVCSDCHNAHGSPAEKSLVRDSINDTCYTCHMEKRGPFVRTHQPVQENCGLCHNPHGSINDNLLKVRMPFLCQQCHEPTSHRGGVAGMTGTGGTSAGIGITLARGCANCHTNIHGSNNPRDVSNERTFRR
jgi:DmsE family decaheme c-type cytochrome